jgi:hypothetical protein
MGLSLGGGAGWLGVRPSLTSAGNGTSHGSGALNGTAGMDIVATAVDESRPMLVPSLGPGSRNMLSTSETTSAGKGGSSANVTSGGGGAPHDCKALSGMQAQPSMGMVGDVAPGTLFRGLRVRMAVATGPVDTTRVHSVTRRLVYHGKVVNRVQSLGDAPHGGQVSVCQGERKVLSHPPMWCLPAGFSQALPSRSRRHTMMT